MNAQTEITAPCVRRINEIDIPEDQRLEVIAALEAAIQRIYETGRTPGWAISMCIDMYTTHPTLEQARRVAENLAAKHAARGGSLTVSHGLYLALGVHS